jgi:hypothetical protein
VTPTEIEARLEAITDAIVTNRAGAWNVALDAKLDAEYAELEAELERQAEVKPEAKPKAPRPRRKWKQPKGDPRITGGWRKVPTRIADAKNLSHRGKAAANAIARATNNGRWNKDLRCDLTNAQLGELMGVGWRSAHRAVHDLLDYLPEPPHDLNRGGVRYHLYGPCTNPKCKAGLRKGVLADE